MILLSTFDFTLPFSQPVLKFLVILIIILAAPLLLNKIKIPHILGLIIAGALVGPHGFNLLERDSGIVLSGTVGLLYIMFQAGIEIDISDFKRNAFKSSFLGLAGFLIPMILGTFAGMFVLDFTFTTSVLMASMFASHTLITYPIVSKLGLTKNRAVNITVGSTLITNILALLVLAIVVGMTTGNINSWFWIKLVALFFVFTLIILVIFPLIARWFFKRVNDNVSQYIFVLVMVFLGAVLLQIAGIEAIIGAFLAGLALNRLIPRTSPLMNRIDFVGNSIFIPFFLISVGMLINYKAFISSTETIFVAIVMSVIATIGKLIPAVITQKTFRFSIDERNLIFGLSNAQAAATLAAVLVGYNIILGHNENGEPVRLLSESILNGTIIMILVTCTIASFVTQKGAINLAQTERAEMDEENTDTEERILIPVSNPDTVEELINLSTALKHPGNKDSLFALNVVYNEEAKAGANRQASKILDKAKSTAAATDNRLKRILRYDQDIVNAINSTVKEYQITDLVMGLHIKTEISESFLGKLTEGILSKNNTTTLVYKSLQPISTIRNQLVVIPENAEFETGFIEWLSKIWNIGRNTGVKIVFYASEKTLKPIREIQAKHPIEADFKLFNDWDNFLKLTDDLKPDDGLIVIMSREKKFSFHPKMKKIPDYLNNHFANNSFMLIYPMQSGYYYFETDLNNPSLIEPIEKIDELGKNIARLFKRK